jgi:hypothetical protein
VVAMCADANMYDQGGQLSALKQYLVYPNISQVREAARPTTVPDARQKTKPKVIGTSTAVCVESDEKALTP